MACKAMIVSPKLSAHKQSISKMKFERLNMMRNHQKGLQILSEWRTKCMDGAFAFKDDTKTCVMFTEMFHEIALSSAAERYPSKLSKARQSSSSATTNERNLSKT